MVVGLDIPRLYRSLTSEQGAVIPHQMGVTMESSFGIISWIIFGALAGWVASMIAGTNREQGWLENIIVGIIGAFLGGILFGLLTGRGTTFGWNVGSFIVAVIGAIVLLFILRLVRRA